MTPKNKEPFSTPLESTILCWDDRLGDFCNYCKELITGSKGEKPVTFVRDKNSDDFRVGFWLHVGDCLSNWIERDGEE